MKLSTDNQTEEIQRPSLPKTLPPFELLGSNIIEDYGIKRELEEPSIDEPISDKDVEILPPLPTTAPPLDVLESKALFEERGSIVIEEQSPSRAMEANSIAPPPPPLPLSFGLSESNDKVLLKVRDKGNLTDGTGLNHVDASMLKQKLDNQLTSAIHLRRKAVERTYDISEGYGKVRVKEKEAEVKKEKLFVNKEAKKLIENGLVPPAPMLPPILFSQNNSKKEKVSKNEKQQQKLSDKEIQQNLAKEAMDIRKILRKVQVERKSVEKNSNQEYDWKATLKKRIPTDQNVGDTGFQEAQKKIFSQLKGKENKSQNTGFSYGQLAKPMNRTVGDTGLQETQKKTFSQLISMDNKSQNTGFSYGQLKKSTNHNVGDIGIKEHQKKIFSELEDKAMAIKKQNFLKPRKSPFDYEQRIMDSYNK